METINYKGMELKEIVLDIPTFFDTDQEAIVWNDSANKDRVIVYSYDPRSDYPVRSNNDRIWKHFAFIPKKPVPRKATYKELAYWLSQGNGETSINGYIYHFFPYALDNEKREKTVDEKYLVRKWGDSQWQEPTIDYLEIKE